ncbi:MAG: LON peptidase substrate-binding domain-containing protein, partial [Thermomicrobiales bacterium]
MTTSEFERDPRPADEPETEIPRPQEAPKPEGQADEEPIVLGTEAPVTTDTDEKAQIESGGGDVQVLPLLPLRGTVVFPLTVVPLAAAQPRSLRLIDEVMSGDRTVALVMQKDSELEGAGPEDVYTVGTIATIHQMMRVPDGSVRLAVQGIERMRILEFVSEEPFLMARVEKAPEEEADSVEVQALMRNTLELFQRLVSLVPHLPDELVTAALNIDDPRHLVYLVATNLRMEPEERQRLLELASVHEKLTSLNGFISKELDVLELGKKLQSEVQEELSKSQREYYLREQMKA